MTDVNAVSKCSEWRLMNDMRGIFSSLWAHQAIEGLNDAPASECECDTSHRDVASATGTHGGRLRPCGNTSTTWSAFSASTAQMRWKQGPNDESR